MDIVLKQAVEAKDFVKLEELVLSGKFSEKEVYVEIINHLSSQCKDINSTIQDALKDTQDDYALIMAAKKGFTEIVKFLVEKGADIHAKNDNSLVLAAAYGHYDVVVLLIENGANIHAQDDYALTLSTQNGHLNIVKYLAENDAYIREETLFESVKNGHFDIVKYLFINYEEYIEKEDIDYSLCLAANNGHIEIVKFLVEKGADVCSEQGDALRYSRNNGYTEITEYLISQGANLNKYKEMYKGKLTDRTELVCGICLSEMNTLEQEIVQCETCKKCVHNECYLEWENVKNSCVYCRN